MADIFLDLGLFGVHRICRCVEPIGEKRMVTGNLDYGLLTGNLTFIERTVIFFNVLKINLLAKIIVNLFLCNSNNI